MMKIFAFKKGKLKEKTQDAIKKRIPDSDSKFDQKLGGFRIWIRIANPTLG